MEFNNYITLSKNVNARSFFIVSYNLSLINGNRYFRRNFLRKFDSVITLGVALNSGPSLLGGYSYRGVRKSLVQKPSKSQKGRTRAITASIGPQALVSTSMKIFLLRVILFLLRVILFLLWFFVWKKIFDFLTYLFFDLLPLRLQQRLTEVDQEIKKVFTILFSLLFTFVTYPAFYVLLVLIFILSYPAEWIISWLAPLFYLFGLDLFVVNKTVRSMRVSSFFDLWWDNSLRAKIRNFSDKEKFEEMTRAEIDSWKNNLPRSFKKDSNDSSNKDSLTQNSLALVICPPAAILSVVYDHFSTSRKKSNPVLSDVSKNNISVKEFYLKK